MSRYRSDLGKTGETLAAKYLVGKGYRLVERNYRCPLGEIDLVAEDRGTLVFVEVKTRRTRSFGPPVLAITERKRRQLTKVALYYLGQREAARPDCRFDIVSVYVGRPDRPAIDLVQNAFSVDNRYT